MDTFTLLFNQSTVIAGDQRGEKLEKHLKGWKGTIMELMTAPEQVKKHTVMMDESIIGKM